MRAATLLERGPLALRFAKEAVSRSLDFALDDGARFEHDLYVLLRRRATAPRECDAFLSKRNPTFRRTIGGRSCRTSWERCTSAPSAAPK